MSSFTADPEVRITKSQISGRTVYVLLTGFEYRVGDYQNPSEIITVPAGTKTDLMSIPSFLRCIINVAHRAHAAIIHDYLLVNGAEPSRADAIFREALGVLGMGKFERNCYWFAVRANSSIKKLLGLPIT
jgi:hypothetical protein